MENLNEIGDGEHPHEFLLRAVPQRRRSDAVVNESKERLSHLKQPRRPQSHCAITRSMAICPVRYLQLRVEDNQLRAGRDQIVAFVRLHEQRVHRVLAF